MGEVHLGTREEGLEEEHVECATLVSELARTQEDASGPAQRPKY